MFVIKKRISDFTLGNVFSKKYVIMYLNYSSIETDIYYLVRILVTWAESGNN